MGVGVGVGVDGSDESRAAVAWAGREAVRRRLPLRVVYAWPGNARVGSSLRAAHTHDYRRTTPPCPTAFKSRTQQPCWGEAEAVLA
ncbi:universal stress protein [Streptomyces sp. NPDC005808]|uniref:universal stress protein n=1 Tax=Streptomyces sp. NPDC005808 TaxID=3364734 RepID=UPI0036AA37B7